MFVKSIKYENFRNLKDGVFTPEKEINIIFGDNANGKTNLTEAVWLFTGQKSFRGNKDAEQINQENPEKGAKLTMDFFSKGRDQCATIALGRKKSIYLNEVGLSSAAALSDSFAAVVFSPAEMQLITEGPAVRRRFLDNAISVLRPKYGRVLASYTRAVAQRNALLKDVQYHSELTFMLDSFEARIASYGAYIISQRQKYLQSIMTFLPDIYGDMSSNREKMRLSYKFSADKRDEPADSADISEQRLAKLLFEARREDMQTLSTGVGPHRDDIEFFINDKAVKTFGSQGQKRSAVLALKLSEAEILKKFIGEQPVTILDDVMSELDRSRQDYILNHIKGWQVFITCCDPAAIEIMQKGVCFSVKNGEVSRGADLIESDGS